MPEPPAAAPADPPALRLAGISKRFGPVLANDGISLDLARGEVLALLGENGAGKSTLVSILFGHYVADAGTIEVFGAPLPPGQPKAALAAGIGMVHQHFTLAANLSVLDNVMLGTEPLVRLRSRRAAARAALLDAAARFGLHVDPDARVADLSVGERQRVEILKALVAFGTKRGARILILDEPTAVLTPQESEALFATLARMVGEGLAIVFISHKLDEVLRVSHRVAVLRGGRLVQTLPAAGADKAMLAEAMVGRRVERTVRDAVVPDAVVPDAVVPDGGEATGAGAAPAAAPAPAPRRRIGDVVCEVPGTTLVVRAGEVFGIAGVAGNGQAALAAVLCGERANPAGPVRVAGRELPPSPARWVEAGVARIPEDRHAVGLVGDLSVWENAMLERVGTPAFSRFGFVRREAALAHARDLVERFDVRGAEPGPGGGLGIPVRQLSGGNQQKLILGRALADARAGAGAGSGAGAQAGAPPLIVADQPTWGLDVGAVAYVHRRLLEACAAGSALVLISEDLDELFALADRIAVMHAGVLGEPRPARAWTLAEIGLAMAGDGARGSASASATPAASAPA